MQNYAGVYKSRQKCQICENYIIIQKSCSLNCNAFFWEILHSILQTNWRNYTKCAQKVDQKAAVMRMEQSRIS